MNAEERLVADHIESDSNPDQILKTFLFNDGWKLVITVAFMRETLQQILRFMQQGDAGVRTRWQGQIDSYRKMFTQICRVQMDEARRIHLEKIEQQCHANKESPEVLKDCAVQCDNMMPRLYREYSDPILRIGAITLQYTFPKGGQLNDMERRVANHIEADEDEKSFAQDLFSYGVSPSITFLFMRQTLWQILRHMQQGDDAVRLQWTGKLFFYRKHFADLRHLQYQDDLKAIQRVSEKAPPFENYSTHDLDRLRLEMEPGLRSMEPQRCAIMRIGELNLQYSWPDVT